MLDRITSRHELRRELALILGHLHTASPDSHVASA
jgi:hypothetical protein